MHDSFPFTRSFIQNFPFRLIRFYAESIYRAKWGLGVFALHLNEIGFFHTIVINI